MSSIPAERHAAISAHFDAEVRILFFGGAQLARQLIQRNGAILQLDISVFEHVHDTLLRSRR